MRLEGPWTPWRRDALIRSHGGLVDPTKLETFDSVACATLRTLYIEVRTLNRPTYYGDRFDRLSLFYVGNEAANALALERRGNRGIAVFLGLPRRLWSAFHLGLSNSGFLRDCFDSEAVPLSAPADRALLCGSDLLFTPENWPSERVDALNDLFDRALTFLLCHEIGHHLRGHLELVRDHLGFDVVDELRGAAASGPDHRLLRMIEFDADIEAADLILLSVLDQAKVNGWSTDKTKAQGFQWMVAVITVFLVFDLEQLPNASHYQGSHPAPVHRAIITAGAFSRTFAREFGWTEEEREFFEDSAWEAVSDIAEQLGLIESRWWGTETAAMDLDLYKHEEKLFLEFEAWISASNTGGSGDPPDWLRR